MLAKRVKHGPNWPLPPDYDSLTEEGKRLARVNACRQWLIKARTTEEKATLYEASVTFMDSYYLRPEYDEDGNTIFNSYFYEADPLPTPLCHKLLMRMHATHRLSMAVLPRGSAKSTTTLKEILLRLVTRPVYKCVYCTSTESVYKPHAERLREQCYMNPRIAEDFGPEYDAGTLKPPSGQGSTGVDYFSLVNRSQIRFTGVDSRQRGLRPLLYVLDDPEYDPAGSTSMEKLRAQMQRLITRIILPMMTHMDSQLMWLGTFVSRRHLLWSAMQTVVGPDGSQIGEMPIFRSWSKMFVPAIYKDKDGREHSFWPHLIPIDAAERERLGLDASVRTVGEVRREMGPDVWAAEMMGAPGAGDGLHFGELSEHTHGWWIRKGTGDGFLNTEPLKSSAVIEWMEDGETHDATLPDLLSQCLVFMTSDTSWSTGPTSDYKTAAVIAIHPSGSQFVLDLWQSRCTLDEQIHAILAMAEKWRVPTIHPEAIREGIQLCDALLASIRTDAISTMGVSHTPAIVPYKPGFTDKASRIASAKWRFDYGKIKLPFFMRDRQPWSDLFLQIEGFNPTAQDCGLRHDDLIDTVLAMPQHIVRTPAALQRPDTGPEEESLEDILERIRNGATVDESGIPYAHRADVLAEILRSRDARRTVLRTVESGGEVKTAL